MSATLTNKEHVDDNLSQIILFESIRKKYDLYQKLVAVFMLVIISLLIIRVSQTEMDIFGKVLTISIGVIFGCFLTVGVYYLIYIWYGQAQKIMQNILDEHFDIKTVTPSSIEDVNTYFENPKFFVDRNKNSTIINMIIKSTSYKNHLKEIGYNHTGLKNADIKTGKLNYKEILVVPLEPCKHKLEQGIGNETTCIHIYRKSDFPQGLQSVIQGKQDDIIFVELYVKLSNYL